MFILEKAVETAKYANHANAEPDGDETRSTRRVSSLLHSASLRFAYLAYFAVSTAEFQSHESEKRTRRLRARQKTKYE